MNRCEEKVGRPVTLRMPHRPDLTPFRLTMYPARACRVHNVDIYVDRYVSREAAERIAKARLGEVGLHSYLGLPFAAGEREFYSPEWEVGVELKGERDRPGKTRFEYYAGGVVSVSVAGTNHLFAGAIARLRM